MLTSPRVARSYLLAFIQAILLLAGLGRYASSHLSVYFPVYYIFDALFYTISQILFLLVFCAAALDAGLVDLVGRKCRPPHRYNSRLDPRSR